MLTAGTVNFLLCGLLERQNLNRFCSFFDKKIYGWKSLCITLDSFSTRLAGSYELNDSIFVFAEIEDSDFDDAPVDIEAHQFGIGIHTPLSDTSDLVGSISYYEGEIEGGGETIEGDGYVLNITFRSKVDAIEVYAEVSYSDLDAESSFTEDLGSETDTTWGVGGLYSLSDTIQLGLGLGEDDVYEFGVRVNLQ